MEKMGLVYEICCGTEQLLEAVAVAKAFPGITMVLNHCGGTPGPTAFKAAKYAEAEWKEAVTELAACPNVYAKVGGTQMPLNG